MNKSDLIEALSIDTGLAKYKAEEVVNTIFDRMTNAIAKDERVEIRGLGSFKIKKYKYKGYTGLTLKQERLSR